MATTTQSEANNFVNQNDMNRKLTHILVSLVLPPIGLVLCLYYIYKVFIGKQTEKLRLALVILVASVAGGAGYWYIASLNHAPVPIPSSVNTILYGENSGTRYTQLVDTVVNGPQTSSGISFKRPVEFSKSSQATGTGGVTSSYYQVNENNKGIGYQAVSSISSKLTGDSKYRLNMAKILNHGEGSDYQSFTSTFKKFVQDTALPDSEVTLGKATPFKGGNIKDNAWQFDVSVESKQTASDKLTPLKGTFIVAMGSKSFYYFGLYTLIYNWAPNQTTWNQVVSSIKIDQ